MRPSAPAPGVGAGDPPSCRPAGLPRFPKLPPTASLTARSTSLAQQLACPPLPAGLGPALPSGRLSTGIQPEEWNGVGRPQQPGPRPWAGSSLCPAHPAGGFQPQVTKGWGHCPTASPTLLGPLAGPFPSPPPRQLLGSTARPRLREGMGLCRPGGPSCPASTCFYCPPHGGSQDPGAWKEAVPQEPKKVSTSIIGALEPYHQASDGAASARPPAPVADRVGPAGGAVLSAVTWDSRGPF